MKINEFFERYSMIFVLSLAFSLTLIPKRYEMPLTFEDWYHLRILKDYLHTFPMKFDFYFLSSLAFLFINSIFEVSLVDFSRFFPSLLYLSSLYLWYLILKIFNSKVALVSSFFLLTSKTFLDTSLIFHPPSLALMLYLLGILFFLKRRFILTFLVGLTLIMTHEFISISFLLSIIFLSFLERRKFHIFIISGCLALTLFLLSSTELKPMEISMKNLQVLILDFGIPHLFLAFLAILFLRRKIFEDRFLVLLSLPILISVTLTSNYVLFSLPMTILSSRFLAGALSSIKTLKFKSSLTFFVLLISFAPSFKLLYDLEPVEMESFHPSLFLGNSSLREVVAFDESRILIFDVTTENEFLSERKEYLKDDLELIYKLDSDILDKYWVRYIYFGEKERVTFSKTSLRKVGVDKLFSGEAEIFDLYPEVVYVLITIDTERDLPPVLFSYHGVEEGVPLILELLKRYEVRATFFVTGEVIESYPEVISKILQNHEVGLHGMFHEDFTLLEKEEKRKRILMAQHALEGLSERAYSFRAPGHSADTELLNILEELGFKVEASAHEDVSYPYHPSEKNWLIKGEMNILRIPLSHTPEYFYPSAIYDKSFIDAYKYVLESQKYRALKVVVIGVHSWEFVELEISGHESYSKPSGEYTLRNLEELFKYLKHKNIRFLTVREFFEIWMSGRRDKV